MSTGALQEMYRKYPLHSIGSSNYQAIHHSLHHDVCTWHDITHPELVDAPKAIGKAALSDPC